METILVGALCLVLGFVVGAGYGALRALRATAARRASAGAADGFARLGLETLPTRSAADILAGRVNIVLGGLPYTLPVLSRRESREWLADLDQSFAFLARELDQAADDKPRILSLLASQTAGLAAMLRSYDRTGVLAEWDPDDASDSEILVAMVEVWRAANPLAAALVEAADDGTDGTISAEPNSPLTPTDGVRNTSTST